WKPSQNKHTALALRTRRCRHLPYTRKTRTKTLSLVAVLRVALLWSSASGPTVSGLQSSSFPPDLAKQPFRSWSSALAPAYCCLRPTSSVPALSLLVPALFTTSF
ncbi:unnamed protein product, partial [Citrullus colocynthis]